ncbi:MAG: hypothetical protein IT310_08300 [Anaerolineales bacterium]|nr:hypothetical protein [Anaerolineales bacterium]
MRLDSADEILQSIRKSQPLTRIIVGGILAYFVSMPLAQKGFSENHAGLVLGWLGFAICLEIALGVSAVLLAQRGEEKYSKILVWGGMGIIAFGIWSDVLATVYYTPDMKIEGNAIIIFLRENGFPLELQYFTGALAQLLLTVIACALWAAFVRHLPLYRSAILAMRPQSLIEFIKAALGGGTYFAKTQKLKNSRSYRFVWWLTLPNVLPFARIVLALDWMGLLPVPSYWLAPLVVWAQALLALSFLFSWLLYVYFENRDALRIDAELTARSTQALRKSCLLSLVIVVAGCCLATALFVPVYSWVTREPESLEVSADLPLDTIPVLSPFSVTYVIKNTGAENVEISRVQTTFWNAQRRFAEDNRLFRLARKMGGTHADSYHPF